MHSNQGNRVAFENLETQKAFCSMAGKQVEQMDAVSQARALPCGLFKAWCLNFMWKNKGSHEGLVWREGRSERRRLF